MEKDKDRIDYIRKVCGQVPSKNEKLRSMVSILEDRLLRDPDDYWSWDALGNLFFSEGFVIQSLTIYQRALEIQPQLPITHLRIGIAYYRLACLDDAIRELEEAVRLDPTLAMAHYYLGFSYYHRGRDEESLGHFRHVCENSPETRIVLYHMAEECLQRGASREAAELLEDLLKFNSQAPTAWHKLGMAYMGMVENGKAVAAFNEALKLNPGDKRSRDMLEMLTDSPHI